MSSEQEKLEQEARSHAIKSTLGETPSFVGIVLLIVWADVAAFINTETIVRCILLSVNAIGLRVAVGETRKLLDRRTEDYIVKHAERKQRESTGHFHTNFEGPDTIIGNNESVKFKFGIEEDPNALLTLQVDAHHKDIIHALFQRKSTESPNNLDNKVQSDRNMFIISFTWGILAGKYGADIPPTSSDIKGFGSNIGRLSYLKTNDGYEYYLWERGPILFSIDFKKMFILKNAEIVEVASFKPNPNYPTE